MKTRLNELKRERDGYDAKIAEKEKHMKSIEAELRAVKANSFDGNRKPTDKAITRQQRFRYFDFLLTCVIMSDKVTASSKLIRLFSRATRLRIALSHFFLIEKFTELYK